MKVSTVKMKSGKTQGGWYGMQRTMNNLRKEAAQIRGKTRRGYIEAALIIRKADLTEAPIVPVDTGNLRNSWFATVGTRTQRGRKKLSERAAERARYHNVDMSKYVTEAQKSLYPMMVYGYLANYAVKVHEDKELKHKGETGAKYMESSIKSHKNDILQKLKENASFEAPDVSKSQLTIERAMWRGIDWQF